MNLVCRRKGPQATGEDKRYGVKIEKSQNVDCVVKKASM